MTPIRRLLLVSAVALAITIAPLVNAANLTVTIDDSRDTVKVTQVGNPQGTFTAIGESVIYRVTLPFQNDTAQALQLAFREPGTSLISDLLGVTLIPNQAAGTTFLQLSFLSDNPQEQ